MAATKKSASKKSASKKRTSKAGALPKSEPTPATDQDCQKVVSDYFELTGDTLEKQVELCREISTKVVDGTYTAEQAQKDWQDSMNRTAEYCQEVTRLWFEGMTRCAGSPGMVMPGFDFFGRDASSGG